MEAPYSDKTRIVINLSSLLLGRALQECLSGNPAFHAMMAGDCADRSDFDPHHLLVDFHAMAQEPQTQWPNAKMILIDTGLPEEDILSLLLHHKFYGVISTDMPLELFPKVLYAVQAGQIWIDNDKIKMLLHNPPPLLRGQGHTNLSKKEQDIVAFVAQGLKNREIAERLCISEQTVKTHISRIFKKVNVISRSQLVPLALKLRV